MLYTGGTTGMPKGVMYAIGGITRGVRRRRVPVLGLHAARRRRPRSPPLVDAAIDAGNARRDRSRALPADARHRPVARRDDPAPRRRHGRHADRAARSTPHELLAHGRARARDHDRDRRRRVRQADHPRPSTRPIEAGEPYDTSSLRMIISSGVMWTAEVKEALLDRIPQVVLIDAMGSTEGSMGMQRDDAAACRRRPAKFSQMPDDEGVHRGRPPGRAGLGRDRAWSPPAASCRSATTRTPRSRPRTFRVIDGVRYSFPGDWARSTPTARSPCSAAAASASTPAARRSSPRRSRRRSSGSPASTTASWSASTDERFGQAVDGGGRRWPTAPTVDEPTIIADVKAQLAGYKAPKRVVFVDAGAPRPERQGRLPAGQGARARRRSPDRRSSRSRRNASTRSTPPPGGAR